MCINGFPHLLLEVFSERNERDRFRMLLQASCITRIANWLRASTTKETILVMAIYIDQDFQAHQYLLWQPDETPEQVVHYDRTLFDLTDHRGAFDFIFQLYNFLSIANADNAKFDNDHASERLAKAKASVENSTYPSITKRLKDETGRNSTRARGPPAGEGANDSLDNSSIQRELARAGYTLTQPISELTPLTPLKPTMRRATSRGGEFVVLKTIFDPNEPRLLRHLNSIKAGSNHTIPLLDVIDLSIGKTVVALPLKSPLDEVLQFCDRPDNVVSLCLQFINGVAFLHQHKVAHRDLKPENVVVDTKFQSETFPRLFIIDFDLARFVESEETMMEDWCGTPPWIAPELGDRDGPIRRYSPILADRWACGQMVKHFAKHFPPSKDERKATLLAFARRLVDVNPRARPKLKDLQVMHGPTKRKSARLQHQPKPKRHAVL
ncbi:kinase-like domain-containing protein [Russula earlei]|uniref:Kinase-like domain-containing protein n=1 Tax=Russula earlei TaxID=71964 RepID=A0ACC0UMX8_9AGAM|nr:kinase-like domain-containing protein [Russula earlei]